VFDFHTHSRSCYDACRFMKDIFGDVYTFENRKSIFHKLGQNLRHHSRPVVMMSF